jgi:hypothetical protein
VLLHPILEEKKAILEEYNWEHPLDLVFIATGNPTGFAHVNEIPRPLLDRLEPIYMDLPNEEVEREIMLKERFREPRDQDSSPIDNAQYFEPDEIARKVAAPWWIMDVVNKTVRYSRICPYVEKRPSIRATNKALDHTYASVEMENKQVANLRHAFYGLRLALRGRVGLRADLIDFDNPRKAFNLVDRLAEDFMWNVIEDIHHDSSFLGDCDHQKLGSELATLLSGEIDLTNGNLAISAISRADELKNTLQRMRKAAPEKVNLALLNESERKLPYSCEAEVVEQWNYSALEMLANICVHEGTLGESNQLFIPHKYQW